MISKDTKMIIVGYLINFFKSFMSKYKIGIIVPTYNESQNLPILLEQVFNITQQNQISTLLLVVDDGSPDGTSSLVSDLSQKYNSDKFEIRLYERSGKQGLATAYLQGIEKIKDEVEYICSMDADLSHQPKYLPNFLNLAESKNLDIVIGSRYVKGGGVENWSWDRKLISRLGSMYAGLVLRTKVNDFTGGYNLYKTTFLESFDPSKQITSLGYLFQIEMKYKIIKSGAKYSESPIIFPDRVFGESKLSGKIVKEALFGVWNMALKN
jgi:dolichol-phosphate mannosyltransferase